MQMAASASQTPEQMLEQALCAGNAASRAKYATRGLSHPALEPDTHQLLLRQLYLSHLESREFAAARAVAEQMVDIGEIPEIAHHDLARACMAQGDLTAAVGYLRLAARQGPPHRRALHFWTLGRALYLNRQFAAALAAFRRALRWASSNQALYRAHAELCLHHLGEQADLMRAYQQLGEAEPLPLYAEFLGGELLRLLDQPRLAHELWSTFIRQVPHSPVEAAVGLWAEARQAQRWLDELEQDERHVK
jgi:tetratricopeptide (TPR) repeat protein